MFNDNNKENLALLDRSPNMKSNNFKWVLCFITGIHVFDLVESDDVYSYMKCSVCKKRKVIKHNKKANAPCKKEWRDAYKG